MPYQEPSPFKKVRVRDDARIQAVLRHLLADECVALLGPPMSEKTHLLGDLAGVLRETGCFWPLYLNLWRTTSYDESAFFTSLARLIVATLAGETQVSPGLPEPGAVPDARAFQNFLETCVATGERHIALLIDHLHALPHDLVHSLLLALRSAYMEREADAPRRLVVVVTGGMNLVGLSAGPTSPFNIARPEPAAPLTPDQSLALAEAALAAHNCSASAGALQRIVHWTAGDRYLLPRLCAWSAEIVQGYRRPRATRAVVERAAARLCADQQSLPPIREAIRMIEEDPDTMLDVLFLLDNGTLPRARSRQMPTRTGTDRLQLSGAVLLKEGRYTLLNQAFRQALAGHFTTERVAHVLRIAGRWNEAIEYLAPRLAARPEQYGARPQLLEATIQSIYAADSLEKSCEILANGLRLGFGLADVGIYRALPAQGRLARVYPLEAGRSPAGSVDLYDPACVEAQTFLYSSYALRGTADEARLVVTLATAIRPIGVVTVERYVRHRDPHELPEELPDLLRFLQHAAGAIENVMIRAAYRAIGQAVLNARALQPTVARVLETVSDALGADYAVLYLVDDHRRALDMAAGVGRPWSPEWQAEAHYALAGPHPAVSCLREQRMLAVRGADERLDLAAAERFGLHTYTRVFLPLHAAGEELGTLELGYASTGRVRLSEGHRRTLGTFADQVAIAVHNMQLLRRTDEALTRKLAELAVGREIQLSLLPRAVPSVGGWAFAAAYQAARTVGGDFYDFCDLPGPPARLGILVADVADKGVPAALFMALSRTIIRTTALSGRGPAAVLTRANELILRDSRADIFLSAIYAVLELDSGRVIYANGGHDRPLWYHAAGGAVTELAGRGIVLGTFEDIRLEEQRVDLAPGDLLVFYTDGVTDALNADGEMFGEARLKAVIAAHAGGSADEMIDALSGALAAFVLDTEPADDVTCVVVKRGSQPAPALA